MILSNTLKNNNLIYYFFLLATLFSLPLSSQVLQFGYDDAGNCILKYRTVVVAPVGHAPQKPQNEQIGERTLTIYPNPTYGLVRVEISGDASEKPINIMLSDMSGKALQSFSTANMNFDVDITSYPQGNYLLIMIIDNKKSTWQIIKK